MKPAESTNMIEIYAEQTDPAKWAAMMICKGGHAGMTAGEAMDMIEATIRKACELIDKKRVVSCPGCHSALYDDARKDGICVDCDRILKAAKRRGIRGPKTSICPECNAVTWGEVHQKPDGSDCDMVYGRRGWRKLGEYDG